MENLTKVLRYQFFNEVILDCMGGTTMCEFMCKIEKRLNQSEKSVVQSIRAELERKQEDIFLQPYLKNNTEDEEMVMLCNILNNAKSKETLISIARGLDAEVLDALLEKAKLRGVDSQKISFVRQNRR